MRRTYLAKSYLLAIVLGSLTQIAQAQPQNPPPKKILAVEASQKLGGPTLVSLHFNQAPARIVVESLAKQAGFAVDPGAVEILQDQPVSIDVERQPFWPVVQLLSSRLQINLGISPDPNFADSERGYAIGIAGDSIQGPGEMCGPFFVVITSTGRSIQLGGDPTSALPQRLIVEFLVLIDPKLHARGQPNGQQLELITDLGGPLQIQRLSDYWATELKQPWPLCWRFKAVAQLVEPGVRSISTLRGQLTDIVAPLAWQRWEINDVLNAKEAAQNVGGATFTFHGLTKTSGVAPFQLIVSSAGRGEMRDFGWPSRTDHDRVASLHLLDSQGRRFLPQSWRSERSTLTVAFEPNRGPAPTQGDPVKVIWDLPTEVAEIQIPFEFKGLPLP